MSTINRLNVVMDMISNSSTDVDWETLGIPSVGTTYNRKFGFSVATSDDGRTIAIGEKGDNSSIGKVHVRRYDGISWGSLETITSTTAQLGDSFGHCISLSQDGSINDFFYQPHRGDLPATLEKALVKLDVKNDDIIGICGTAGGLMANTLGLSLLDVTSCQIEAPERLTKEMI